MIEHEWIRIVFEMSGNSIRPQYSTVQPQTWFSHFLYTFRGVSGSVGGLGTGGLAIFRIGGALKVAL